MSIRNCRSALRNRSRTQAMCSYDALPPDLRRWLTAAALPWSARSAQKAWVRALRKTQGDRANAIVILSQIERRLLEHDVARIWGQSHPFLSRDQKSILPRKRG